MSDFGFDAYALDEDDVAGHPHPLEIARDLIATGKPRSALEVLGLHHQALCEDPEYLLICSEAWWTAGDIARAQQALLGAVRLAPDDPVPLRLLGELLRERGEEARADLLFAKARALEGPDRSSEAESPALDDDLIAFAEQRERAKQAGLTSKQLVAVLLALASTALVVASIVWITRLESTAAPSRGPADRVAEVARPPSPPSESRHASEVPVRINIDEDLSHSAVAEAIGTAHSGDDSEIVEEPDPAERARDVGKRANALAAPPEPRLQEATSEPKQAELQPRRRTPKSTPRPKRKVSSKNPQGVSKPRPRDSEPEATLSHAELSSMDAPSLTDRADALYRQGQTATAAGYYRHALDLDPDFAPAMVGIGRSILRAEKYDEAMSNATRALQLARGVDARPGLEAEAIYQIARVHLQRGELDAARRLFRQSISLSGAPPAAWFYLGEALWNDNSPAAREAYERYLDLVPEGHLAERARRAIQ